MSAGDVFRAHQKGSPDAESQAGPAGFVVTFDMADHRIALAHDLETVLCRQGPRDAEQLLDKIGDTWGRPVAQAAIEMLAQICGSDCGELRASFIHDQRAHFATEDQLDDTFEPRGTTKAGRGS